MTNANLLTASPAPARRRNSPGVPFVLAARKPNRPLPAISLRVPVTPANRSYLRKLRNDEMRAWHSGPDSGQTSSVRNQVTDLQREQKDLYTFGLIVTLTMILVGVAFAHSAGVTQHCAHLVSFVRHLIG